MSNSKEFEVIIPSAFIRKISVLSISSFINDFGAQFLFKGFSETRPNYEEFLIIAPSLEVANDVISFLISLRGFVRSSASRHCNSRLFSKWYFSSIRDCR